MTTDLTEEELDAIERDNDDRLDPDWNVPCLGNLTLHKLIAAARQGIAARFCPRCDMFIPPSAPADKIESGVERNPAHARLKLPDKDQPERLDTRMVNSTPDSAASPSRCGALPLDTAPAAGMEEVILALDKLPPAATFTNPEDMMKWLDDDTAPAGDMQGSVATEATKKDGSGATVPCDPADSLKERLRCWTKQDELPALAREMTEALARIEALEKLAIDDQCGKTWKSQCLRSEFEHAELGIKYEKAQATITKLRDELNCEQMNNTSLLNERDILRATITKLEEENKRLQEGERINIREQARLITERDTIQDKLDKACNCLEDLANELVSEVADRYHGTLDYKSQRARLLRDMVPVDEARKILSDIKVKG